MADSFSLFPSVTSNDSSNVKMECTSIILEPGTSHTFDPGTDFMTAVLELYSCINHNYVYTVPSSVVIVPNMEDYNSYSSKVYCTKPDASDEWDVGNFRFQGSTIELSARVARMVCAFIVFREAA